MVLHSGAIAEMITGEGKTLVATLPAYLNAIEGKGVHVVTVNDYLARRDMEWMGPLYLGPRPHGRRHQWAWTRGSVRRPMPATSPTHEQRIRLLTTSATTCGMAARGDDRFPKHNAAGTGPLNYAIVDEVDNILIDEARTPLIISGPAHDDVTKYARADGIARLTQAEQHFEIKGKGTHRRRSRKRDVRTAEKLAGVESLYTVGNMEWPHLIDNSLKAHHLYKRDVNYFVQNGEVDHRRRVHRTSHARPQWSDGLHQAVEAKEGVADQGKSHRPSPPSPSRTSSSSTKSSLA